VRHRRSVAGGRFGLPWQRRGKRSLRKNLPGIDDRHDQDRCNNQAAKHQGVSPSRTMESEMSAARSVIFDDATQNSPWNEALVSTSWNDADRQK
jgi:hypothetical protein